MLLSELNIFLYIYFFHLFIDRYNPSILTFPGFIQKPITFVRIILVNVKKPIQGIVILYLNLSVQYLVNDYDGFIKIFLFLFKVITILTQTFASLSQRCIIDHYKEIPYAFRQINT